MATIRPRGFALAGGRVINFTSGQGSWLMKEVLYTIAGKRLPALFHVGARALTSQALNVHCGHDDVMAVADSGRGIAFAAAFERFFSGAHCTHAALVAFATGGAEEVATTRSRETTRTTP